MSYRPHIQHFPVITNGSMAGNLTSSVTILDQIPGISYDVAWTGTPVGVFTVEVSNTYRQNPDGTAAVAGNWTALPLILFNGNFPTPAGSASNGMIDVPITQIFAVRLVYTRTSGSGTLNVVATAKVL